MQIIPISIFDGMPKTSQLNTDATALSTLEGLPVGESARILALNVEGDFSKRFSALGLRPGNWVRVLRSANLGGPMHLRIGTTELILRRHEARSVSLAP